MLFTSKQYYLFLLFTFITVSQITEIAKCITYMLQFIVYSSFVLDNESLLLSYFWNKTLFTKKKFYIIIISIFMLLMQLEPQVFLD